jgi:hypothetical protein
MELDVPAIYAGSGERARLGLIGRLTALGVSAGCLAVLLVAIRIKPNASGIGTHEQMGFAGCQFERRTGLPCPTCGMTTSYAYFVRGNWVASFYVQPAGWVAAVATAMGVWAGLYVGLTGRPAYRLVRVLPSGYYLAPFFAVVVLGWTWKIWIHLIGRDGW